MLVPCLLGLSTVLTCYVLTCNVLYRLKTNLYCPIVCATVYEEYEVEEYYDMDDKPYQCIVCCQCGIVLEELDE